MEVLLLRVEWPGHGLSIDEDGVSMGNVPIALSLFLLHRNVAQLGSIGKDVRD